MTWCYRCHRPAQYRVVATRQPLHRRLLRLPPRHFNTCSTHRLDPLTTTRRQAVRP